MCVHVHVCVCACILGEGVRAGRPLTPCSLVVLLDSGTSDLEEVSSWLSELIHCTPGMWRSRCWSEVTQKGGGLPGTEI